MQLLERVKTVFIYLTNNENVKTSNSKVDIEKAVKEIQAQESGNIEKLEKLVEDVNIPLEDEKIVKKVQVNEKAAQEAAEKQTRTKQSKEKQLGE